MNAWLKREQCIEIFIKASNGALHASANVIKSMKKNS